MNKTILISLFLIFTSNIYGQKNNDSTIFATGFEPAFHNIALLQAPKGRFYYKNTDIVYLAFGKNFWDRFEIEIGILPNPAFYFFAMAHAKAKLVFPISDKLKFGFGYNISFINIAISYSPNVNFKQEIFTGISYKKSKSLHSFNLHFGQIQNVMDIGYGGQLAYSMTYVYMNNFSKKWSIISDNKLYIVPIKFNFQDELEGYGDFNFFLFENLIAFRHHSKRQSIDFGALYFFGMKEWEFKFTPTPYISYSLNF